MVLDMPWRLGSQYDPVGAALADRHYSRQTVGSPKFMPPGRQLVLVAVDGSAVWGTSWPFSQFVSRVYPGAWVCSIFRNEGQYLSSELIRSALAVTAWHFGVLPEEGCITLVNPSMVRPKRDPGRCFRRAGFVPCGYTKRRGLLILRCPLDSLPLPLLPAGAPLRQLSLFGGA